jgi:hypothetical protein
MIDVILDDQLPDWPAKLKANLRRYMFNQQPDTEGHLLMAKTSTLAGLTSCATFFDNVHNSG